MLRTTYFGIYQNCLLMKPDNFNLRRGQSRLAAPLLQLVLLFTRCSVRVRAIGTFGLLLFLSNQSTRADIIAAENLITSFEGTSFGLRTGEIGHSFTTGSNPAYDRIAVRVYTTPGDFNDGTNSSLGSASDPEAEGALFLLSSEFIGAAEDLDAMTPGFVAKNLGISAGSWYFDSSITLAGNTQYWFYTQGYLNTVPTFGIVDGGADPGPYAGGQSYAINSTTGNFLGASNFDLGFTVSSVPEPNSLLLFTFSMAALASRRRPLRRKDTRFNSPEWQ